MTAVRPLVVMITAAGVLGLAACSGSSSHHTTASPVTSPSSSASSSASPAPAATNPLTGEGPVPTTPLISVKIDDTPPGRPQVGIDKADVVYIEAVEGGLDRLNALFGTNKPVVGYVRSTRPSDPELLKQYGNITEAYSGGEYASLGILHRSGIQSWDFGTNAGFFYRVDRSQSSYINLELNLAQVAKHIKTPAPKSNGWTFSPTISGLPTTTGTDVRTTVTGTYPVSSGQPIEFKWDAKLARYVRYIDGVAQRAADGRLVTATNVIVQSCIVRTYAADLDVNHNPAQFTYTVGSGAVSVFRDGQQITGTWKRATATDGTTLQTSSGTTIPLQPGNTWVVLIRNGVPVQG